MAVVAQELLKMEKASGGSHTYCPITVKPNPDGTICAIDLSPDSSEVLSVLVIPSSFAYKEVKKGHDIHFSVSVELMINFALLLMRGEKPDIIHVKESHWIDEHLNEFIVIADFAAKLDELKLK